MKAWLATFVLAVMEGGVMLSRSYGAVEPFDRAVSQLREHFRLILRSGGSPAHRRSSPPPALYPPGSHP